MWRGLTARVGVSGARVAAAAAARLAGTSMAAPAWHRLPARAAARPRMSAYVPYRPMASVPRRGGSVLGLWSPHTLSGSRDWPRRVWDAFMRVTGGGGGRPPKGFEGFFGDDEELPSKKKSSEPKPADKEQEEGSNGDKNKKDNKDNKEKKTSKPSSSSTGKKPDGKMAGFFRMGAAQMPGGGGGGGGGGKKMDWGSLLYTGIAFAVFSWLFGSASDGRGFSKEITFQEFKKYLAGGNVESVTVYNKEDAVVKLVSGATAGSTVPSERSLKFRIGSVESFERSLEQLQKELGVSPLEYIPVKYSSASEFGAMDVVRLLPSLLMLGFLVMMFTGGPMGMGGGGGPGKMFQIGKAKPNIITKETKVKTSFRDVAGLNEAKTEVLEFVNFLKNPKKFTDLGARLPKGALLVGPPGTGKTLMARATAGEAQVPFLSISGSDFLEMFVGVGPSRVRDLFKQARELAPCIVFIDEIDAVGRARGKGGFSGGNDERENTLNQLLVEMDGFETSTGVVVLAGTNRADILDQALLRPGRFDRQILIDKPDIRGRKEIFEVHLRPLTLTPDVTEAELAQRLAALTPGMAGADIANLCNEAALIAARHDRKAIELVDFESATDRVIGGLEKPNKVMSPDEKKRVAYHECGHAVAGWFLEHADPLLKVTIVPRGEAALGYAQYLPQEFSLYTKEQLLDKMCMALGGRAAEEIFFGKISTGAADDLKRVTGMAYHMVTVYGMSERLGHVHYPPDEGQQFQKPFSDGTAQVIDEEVQKMIRTMYDRTKEVLTERKDYVDRLATRLMKEETINHDIIVDVLGQRPFKSHTYDEYVRHASTRDWDTKEDHAAVVAKKKAAAASGDAAPPEEGKDDEKETKTTP